MTAADLTPRATFRYEGQFGLVIERARVWQFGVRQHPHHEHLLYVPVIDLDTRRHHDLVMRRDETVNAR